MQKLAEALRERRGDASLRGVARELGVATGTAESWLKGWRTPGIENIPTIADYLDRPIEEVIQWLVDDFREKIVFSGKELPEPIPKKRRPDLAPLLLAA